MIYGKGEGEKDIFNKFLKTDEIRVNMSSTSFSLKGVKFGGSGMNRGINAQQRNELLDNFPEALPLDST